MFYDVLCLKSILGFLLSERTSGVSPVIFIFIQCQVFFVLNLSNILKRGLLLKAAIAELESERIDLEQKVASMHEAEEKMSQ